MIVRCLNLIWLLGLSSLNIPISAAENNAMTALVAAYPEVLSAYDHEVLIWKDGTRMPISDGRSHKTLAERLNTPDLDDMFAFHYPLGDKPQPPEPYHDPGRVRYQPFFLKAYGDCRKGQVALHLKSINWLPNNNGGQVKLTTRHGAAQALARVSAELDVLPKKLIRHLIPLAGSYNCRMIAGTQRLSMHAFGAAIDINIKSADYWRWNKPNAAGHYRWRNKLPREIIDIFERHGFIWGGRWYHFDTMHFEYRPEFLLLKHHQQQK